MIIDISLRARMTYEAFTMALMMSDDQTVIKAVLIALAISGCHIVLFYFWLRAAERGIALAVIAFLLCVLASALVRDAGEPVIVDGLTVLISGFSLVMVGGAWVIIAYVTIFERWWFRHVAPKFRSRRRWCAGLDYYGCNRRTRK